MKVRTADDVVFFIDEAVVAHSRTLCALREDCDATTEVPLPTIYNRELQAICDYYLRRPSRDFTLAEVWPLLNAAHYLHMDELLDVLVQVPALYVNGETPEEIRRHFDL